MKTYDNESPNFHRGARRGRIEALAQIRARRDELCDGMGSKGLRPFYDLFGPGAEFGPDKPEPEWKFIPGEDGFVFVAKDGTAIDNMRADTFNAIKRLGVEEAKDE